MATQVEQVKDRGVNPASEISQKWAYPQFCSSKSLYVVSNLRHCHFALSKVNR
jgi:hypothetical protein